MTPVSRKQIVALESEKRYLDKSIKHLENILEATHTYKKQEVSELNRIHVETIKVTLQHLNQILSCINKKVLISLAVLKESGFPLVALVLFQTRSMHGRSDYIRPGISSPPHTAHVWLHVNFLLIIRCRRIL